MSTHPANTTSTKCWSNAGPPSATLAQHQTSSGSTPRVCWATFNPVNTKLLYNICTILGQRRRRWADAVQMLYKCFVFAGNKWNESGFRPPLCTYRLNWARRTSWGWWDEWDDTVLQTQDSKFEPWRSEAELATSRSRRLPTILTFTRGWGRNIFCFFQTAVTGNRTPDSGVKGSGANHYPRAPALAGNSSWYGDDYKPTLTQCLLNVRPASPVLASRHSVLISTSFCGCMHSGGTLRSFATICDRMRRFATICDRSRQFAIVCDSLRPFAIVCDGLQPFVIVCDRLRRFATVCDHLRSFATVWDRFAMVCDGLRLFASLYFD